MRLEVDYEVLESDTLTLIVLDQDNVQERVYVALTRDTDGALRVSLDVVHATFVMDGDDVADITPRVMASCEIAVPR